MKEQKKLLRKQITQEKSLHPYEQRMKASKVLLEQLEKHPLFVSASTVLLYHSLKDEVIEKWHHSKRILLPVVKEDILVLKHYTGKKCLEPGAFHIEEPEGAEFTEYKEINLAIIPGVSFDMQGNRLGRGKGYYDKLLPLLSSYNIGICYQFQAKEHIPSEEFDRKMDEVWTENGIFYPRK